MSVPLAYPVLWADAKTAAKLICMGESTFREHVASGLLPQGALIGGKRLWRVADIDEALAKMLPSEKDADEPGADPVLERIHERAGNGRAAKTRR